MRQIHYPFLHRYIKRNLIFLSTKQEDQKRKKNKEKFWNSNQQHLFKPHNCFFNKLLLTCLWGWNRCWKTERTLSYVVVDFECIKRDDILYCNKIIKPKYNELHFYVYHKNTFKFVFTKRRYKYRWQYFTSYKTWV